MGFLEQIVAEVREGLAESRTPESPSPRPTHPRPGFRESIERDRDRGALVVEYKRVSPGRSNARLPRRTIREFVRATESARPSAYSCLATRTRFEGSPQDVRALARATDRAVLYKEFVIDPRQVDLAARCGASAILLIARLEEPGFLDQPLARLAERAHRRGLEVLLELHDRTELSRAAGVGADVYGVNSRDLDTLTIARASAEATIRGAVRDHLRPLLGMSGVEEAGDARRFWDSGVDGILVGSAVARSGDPAAFLSSLVRDPDGGRP
jgi:indole-3-glycerol phosphate synthase